MGGEVGNSPSSRDDITRALFILFTTLGNDVEMWNEMLSWHPKISRMEDRNREREEIVKACMYYRIGDFKKSFTF